MHCKTTSPSDKISNISTKMPDRNLLKEDGFITTVGNSDLGAKYGNILYPSSSKAIGPPPTSFTILK